MENEVQETTEMMPYSATAMAMVAQAEAEVRAMCAMAVKFPRDMDVVRERLLKECKRPSFAESALYSKPVGTKSITGLSIRFAEAAIASMGHIHTTTKTLAESDEYRKIEIRVWDAQAMISYADEATVEKTIERRSIDKRQEYIRMRVNKSGDTLYIIRATEDDLLNKVNSAKSKSIRNSGLRMVPGWLLDECKQAIQHTNRSTDAADPDAAKRKLFDSFASIGVTVEHIKKYLGHDVETLQPAELEDLRQLYTAVKDGETTLSAIFKQREEESNGEAVPDAKMGTAALKSRLAPKPEEALITPAQIKVLWGTSKGIGWTEDDVHKVLKAKYGYDSVKQIKVSQVEEFMAIIQSGT